MSANADEVISLIDKTKYMCAKAGLRVHKNDKDMIQYLEPDDRAKDLNKN